MGSPTRVQSLFVLPSPLQLVTVPCRLPLCSPEYVALLRGTQALGTRELQELSRQYDAVYFHPVCALETHSPQTHPRACACSQLWLLSSAGSPLFMNMRMPCTLHWLLLAPRLA